MRRVFQTIIDSNKGNCMQATIASLLDLILDEVPHFITHKNWGEIYIDFLEKKGFEEVAILYNPNRGIFTHGAPNATLPEFQINRLKEYDGVNGLFYASIYSPKYYSNEVSEGQRKTHAVLIDKDYNVVHDPNPYNKGIAYPEADVLKYNGVLQVWIIQKKKVKSSPAF